MADEKHTAQSVDQVHCAVVTVSDTRTDSDDASGKLIRESLASAGHRVAHHAILPDEPDQVRSHVAGLCADGAVQAIVLTGGTGISPRDSTYEAVVPLFDKSLDGFGELFRMLSFEEVGAAAMLSRAVAGVCDRTAVFALPGSVGAVRLAMDRLILPQLGHLVALLRG